jgi:SAM-dependent methyltransferase
MVAGAARRAVPTPALFLAMRLLGMGNGAEEQPDAHLRRSYPGLGAGELALAGRHVVEIGSGRHARLALQLLAAGAERVTLVDYYALPLDHPGQRATLLADCARLGLAWDDVRRRVRPIAGEILDLAPADLGAPADLVLSSAVLEHVRDPAAILARCYAWLRPGGATFHMVDLRDHNFHFRYPFEMLAYSDQTWRRWIDLRGGFHVNRWRAHEHLQALADAGFVQITYAALASDPDALAVVRGRLDRRFRDLPERLLAIAMISLYGRRPAAVAQ